MELYLEAGPCRRRGTAQAARGIRRVGALLSAASATGNYRTWTMTMMTPPYSVSGVSVIQPAGQRLCSPGLNVRGPPIDTEIDQVPRVERHQPQTREIRLTLGGTRCRYGKVRPAVSRSRYAWGALVQPPSIDRSTDKGDCYGNGDLHRATGIPLFSAKEQGDCVAESTYIRAAARARRRDLPIRSPV